MASYPGNKRSRKYSTEKNNWVEDTLQPATKFNNMIDPSTWVVGSTGDQTGFAQYGLTAENSIIEGFGPSRVKIPLWNCSPSGDGGGDGGFSTEKILYDPAKAYRISCFYKRTGTNTGSVRVGTVSDATPTAYLLSGGDATTSYLIYASTIRDVGWILAVGYLFPHNYSGTVDRGGEYTLADGSVDSSNTTSHKSNSSATLTNEVSSVYGMTTTTNNVKFTRARLELIDGTAPPLALMLAHTATFTADYTDTVITGSDGSENKMYVATTRPDMADGDYWIDYSTGENRVFYYTGGVIVELAPYIDSSDPLAPSGMQIESVDPVYRSKSVGGKRSLRSSAPQYYNATLKYPPQTKAEFAKVSSFIDLIRNTSAPFYLSLPQLNSGQGSGLGMPLVNGASQTGSTLVTDGWDADEIGLMLAGDPLKISGSDKVYKTAYDVDSDSSGNASIVITPKLQFTPADNAAIVITNIEMKVDLIKDHDFAVSAPSLFAHELDVEEVIE